MTAKGRDFDNLPVDFKTLLDGTDVVPYFKMQPADIAALSGLTNAELRATPVPVSAPLNGFAIDVNGAQVEAANPLPVTLTSGSTVVVIGTAQEDSPHVSGDNGFPMFGIRSDSDVATAGDGDYTLLKLDEEGRLKVASKPASYPATTGNVTSATSTVFVNTTRFSNLMIHCTGTFAGVNVTFEGSLNSTNGTDGTWFGVQAIRSNANTIELTTGVLGAAPAYAWELSVNALKYFRVRATAWTSGTQVWTMIPGTYATEPIPAAQVSATQPVSGTVTATVAAASLLPPNQIADVASAAITSTATSATANPNIGVSYSVSIPVTVVSGTNPTLDIMVQESDDGGTNWYDVYQFPRITATGIYRSPALMFMGNRVRYVQTITGTTPSFTRAINRLQRQDVTTKCAQLFDRAISLTTLNAATASLNTMGVENAELVINIGTATTPPQLQLEGSDDNANWYALGSPLTAVASSTVKVTVPDVRPAFIRARVSTVGVTVVAGYVLIKGF